MSTVKADTLQPTISGNNLILKTGSGDVERLRITPTGTMTVASGVGTVFAGGVSFSAPMNVNGKMGIGAAYGGTPVVDLDIVSAANASVLDPQFNTFNTTQTRAVAAFRTSASNTTLFFGHGGISAAWIQAQSSDPGTAQRSILLNPVGGNVGIGTTGPVVALDVVGQARCSSGTTASDSSSTLTTKSYVDSLGTVIFDNIIGSVINVTLSTTHTSRQTVELHPHVPATAKYVIMTLHAFANGNTPYNIWFGKSTTVNSGHRTHYQTDSGGGDATTNSVQVILPINKISSTSRQVYWNVSSNPNPVDTLFGDINGYVV